MEQNNTNAKPHIEELKPEEFRHRIPLQLRFNDVDILGHVNNTVYFSFYDTGKAHYFNDVLKEKMDWQNVDTVIAHINCSYISPIVFGEQIEVRTRCIGIGEKSLHLEQILIETDSDQIKSVCRTVMVGYNPQTKHSEAINERKKAMFCEYENKNLIEQP